MRSLLEICREEPDRFGLFLLDIDGTVLLRDDPIPGAPEFIRHLRENNLPFRFFTNCASQSKMKLARRMTGAGIPASPEDFYTCADPLPEYFEKEARKAGRELRYFLLGKQEEIPGVVTFEQDYGKIMDCDGVLQKDTFFIWRDVMPAQINFFRRYPEKPYVLPNPDRLYPVEDGNVNICSGGCAKFVCAMLEECGIKKECIFLGKPYAPIYDSVRELFAGVEKKRIAGVGDFLYSDILGANRNGITSVLVMTGMTNADAAQNASGELKPALICRSLG